MTNTSIGDRYILHDMLGSGGMGTVYLGTDTRTDQTVAIKQLKAEVAQPETIERFRREGEALRDLNHPNIVKMLDMFEHDGQHYLVMEYIAGGNLADLIDGNSIPLETILSLSIDLADSLTRAHKLNIIHRDLKPENVLIGDDGILRLTDFGIARIGSRGRVTETGLVLGTLPYMPPEAFDDEPIDTRYDVWAFGVMLFEMLMGERPFDANGMIANILSAPIPDIEAMRPDVPIALVDLVYRMLQRNIDTRIPSVRIVGAELEAIQQGRVHKPQQTQRFESEALDFSARPRHNLPAQTTPFVGREHELDELNILLKDSSTRLITILAQGGMGKTRLSIELAQFAVDQNLYADGVYFVELAPLSSADNVPNAIGDACGFQFLGEGTPKEQLLTILRERNLLLVLDNYEHLPEGFALVSDILQAAPQVSIVATSRQRLSQAGETLFRLLGMEFPTWETPNDALSYASVKLFMNSAKRVRPDFELIDDHLDDVARICKLVEGMPLGLLLAASWLAVLSLNEIADEIQGGLDFLETDETELPERQRSMRAVIDYSWSQINEAEQKVFMKLSVFRGGFTREAAQVVAGANLRVLMSLVNKSLIRRDADNGRYEIHELLRQFAEEHLQQSREFETTHTKHMSYFADFMADRTADVKGKRQIDSLEEIALDFDNVQLAWRVATESVRIQELDKMMETVALFCEMRSLFFVGIALFSDTLETLADHSNEFLLIFNRLRLRYIGAVLSLERTSLIDELEILTLLLECSSTAKRLDDVNSYGLSLWLLGEIRRLNRDLEAALSALKQALEVYNGWGDEYYIGRSIGLIVQCEINSGQYNAELHNKSVALTTRIGDYRGLSRSLASKTAFVDHETVFEIQQELIAIGRQLGESHFVGLILNHRSIYAFLQGNFTDAEQLLNESDFLLRNTGWSPYHGSLARGFIAVIQGNLSDAYDLLIQLLPWKTMIPHFREREIHYNALVLMFLALIDPKKRNHYVLEGLQLVNEPFEPLAAKACIPIVGVIMHERGQFVRSVELLGLTSKYADEFLMGWTTAWERINDTYSQLQAELSDDIFNQAWEHGKSLDLETVVQDLIEEFSEDTH